MSKAGKLSLVALMVCVTFQACVSLIYHPKWQHVGTEAMIAWDVSGYYFYLPAVFIYKDVKEVAWRDHIYERYRPGYDQTFTHESGNEVMKYSAGMAVQYLPAFLAGHLYASLDGHYPADGFSQPYQLALTIWVLLVAAIGLWLLRYFLSGKLPDWGIASVLLLYTFGTNYLDYTAIHGAMSHNFLFLYYAALLIATERFYRQYSLPWALTIGAIIGFMSLIRPTEIISAILPLLYGVSASGELKERFKLIGQQWQKYAAAALATAAIGSIQLIYWKYVSGSWLVYSYEEQGFSWLSPHIYRGLFTYKSGWLVYTPILILVFPGFYYLFRRQRPLFWPILIHTVLFIYVAFAWDIWWYGASLGQRAMVQSYPVLALPFGLFLVSAWRSGWLAKGLLVVFMLSCGVTYNLWLTHHAHKGGLLECGNMNREYFWHILGKSSIPVEGRKLLDTDELYKGDPPQLRQVLYEDFETAPDSTCAPLAGNGAVCFTGEWGKTLDWSLDSAALLPGEDWIRLGALFNAEKKEWNIWDMHRLMVRLFKDEKLVWERHIKIHRQLDPEETKRVYIDMSFPDRSFDEIRCSVMAEGSPHPITVDDVAVSFFSSSR